MYRIADVSVFVQREVIARRSQSCFDGCHDRPRCVRGRRTRPASERSVARSSPRRWMRSARAWAAGWYVRENQTLLPSRGHAPRYAATPDAWRSGTDMLQTTSEASLELAGRAAANSKSAPASLFMPARAAPETSERGIRPSCPNRGHGDSPHSSSADAPTHVRLEASAPIPYATPAASDPTTSISSPLRTKRASVTSARVAPTMKSEDERERNRHRIARGVGHGDQVGGERHHPCGDEADERCQSVARGLAPPRVLGGLHVRPAREVVAGSHRDPVGEEIREAEDENDAVGEGGTHDRRDNGKGRRDAVVGAEDEVGKVAAKEGARTGDASGRARHRRQRLRLRAEPQQLADPRDQAVHGSDSTPRTALRQYAPFRPSSPRSGAIRLTLGARRPQIADAR